MRIRRAVAGPWGPTSGSDRHRAVPVTSNGDGSRARRELAADLHGGVAQLLALCEIRLSTVEQDADVTQARRFLSQAIQSTRTMIHGTEPLVASSTNFLQALERIVVEMGEYGLVSALSEGPNIPYVDPGVIDRMCRCVRELLFNILKHAGVAKAEIVLSSRRNTVMVRVLDCGRGFSPRLLARKNKARSNFGLSEIRAQLADIGGTLKITSHLGTGTTMTLLAPAQRREKGARSPISSVKSIGRGDRALPGG